ncbi:MAG: bifunctional riboflavin kinase/FAD synthetase [Alphaproteobacteria bacterium]
MEIIRHHEGLPAHLRGLVLALGNFDGVHRGHQAVLALAQTLAKNSGVPSGVLFFEPHPRRFFQPDTPYFRLTPQPLKLRLMQGCGLDVAIIQPFDAALASSPADSFITDMLVEKYGVGHVIVGWNFRFGKGRAGDAALLEQRGKELGFSVTVLEPQGSNDAEPISSTRIRALLEAGKPVRAAELLGYWWRVSATVVGGDQRGQDLGFPTANMVLAKGVNLAHGIYAVRVRLQGRRHHGAAYLGTRPTFGGGEVVLEVYLLEFSGDLYGRELEVEFIEFLRGDEEFDGAASLTTQMERDCTAARDILTRLDVHDPIGQFTMQSRLRAPQP